MFTRCPNCQTYFRIFAEHLIKANGEVRCGQCFVVFNSIGNLFEQLPSGNSGAKALVQLSAGQNVDSNPLAETSSSLHTAPEGIHPTATTWSQTAKLVEQPDESFSSSDRNSLTSDTHHTSSSSSKSTSSSRRKKRKNKFAAKKLIKQPFEFVARSRRNTLSASEIASNTIWGLAAFFLFTVLVIQYSYFMREELARHAVFRPWIQTVCNIAKCELPLRREIRYIKLTRRDITTHPRVKRALMINATMANEAKFYQPYPIMQIRLSNTAGRIIASREFPPRDYLDADINIRKGIPPNNPVQIVLEIVDPGEDAVNFEFNFSHNKI